MSWAFLLFVFWLVIVSGLTFMFWIRPRSFFKASGKLQADIFHWQVLVGAGLAILLFISCYVLGAWLAFIEYKGFLWMPLV